jgi:hypothetical protein
MRYPRLFAVLLASLVPAGTGLSAAERPDGIVFVEAESFEQPGGWKLDTQFINIMGSPYMLAHGLGKPVDDASTTVAFPEVGEYSVFVRTKDWVARWNAPGTPGKFRLVVDGKPLAETFGTKGADWHWQSGGKVSIDKKEVKLALRDLAGFGGRCDAILFAKDSAYTPPNSNDPHAAWRKQLLGLPEEPVVTNEFDLVVVGGGYSGCGTAISASRMGCRVALIQNRPVLGGNSSSEIRVWPQGKTRRGLFPRIGEIIEEFSPNPKESPGTKEEFEDDLKTKVVSAEKNISLYLNHHAYKVEKEDGRITAVVAFDTRTGEHKRFVGKFFTDCTGHGTIGFLAGADYETTEKGHMGMSNMWRWAEADTPQPFPEVPWALDLKMDDFPYPGARRGQTTGGAGPWFWETGFDKDPIEDLEYMRDWNLRAVFGAWNAMKNRGGKAQHENAVLEWVAYVGGTRESRRILGDLILTEEDVSELKAYPDATVPSTWSIDLHYARPEYIPEKYPEDPFISVAKFQHHVDRTNGYPVPYRCFYSRNVPNLFTAGRCISVTHEALGTVRVMKTCGMMGEVVGKAASICLANSCGPREVYEQYLPELKKLLELPGVARRDAVTSPIYMDGPVPPVAVVDGPKQGIVPSSLPGIVVDSVKADYKGKWGSGTGLEGYIGFEYRYSTDPAAEARFPIDVEKSGMYEIRLAYRDHENRGTNVPVEVRHADGKKELVVNMRERPKLDHGFTSLGTFRFEANRKGAVVVSAKDAGGHACVDAIQILAVE